MAVLFCENMAISTPCDQMAPKWPRNDFADFFEAQCSISVSGSWYS